MADNINLLMGSDSPDMQTPQVRVNVSTVVPPNTIGERELDSTFIDTFLTDSGVDTLTNKTIDGNSNTLVNIPASKLLIASQAIGDLLYASSSTVWSRLGIGATGYNLGVVSGLPAWIPAGQTPDEDITGTSSTTSSTYANITGADVSITLTVASNILLIATVQAYCNIDLAPYTITWHDGSTVIGGPARVYLRSSNPRTTVTVHTVVVAAAIGVHTYTVQHKSEDNSTSCTAETFSCIAFPVPA